MNATQLRWPAIAEKTNAYGIIRQNQRARSLKGTACRLSTSFIMPAIPYDYSVITPERNISIHRITVQDITSQSAKDIQGNLTTMSWIMNRFNSTARKAQRNPRTRRTIQLQLHDRSNRADFVESTRGHYRGVEEQKIHNRTFLYATNRTALDLQNGRHREAHGIRISTVNQPFIQHMTWCRHAFLCAFACTAGKIR